MSEILKKIHKELVDYYNHTNIKINCSYIDFNMNKMEYMVFIDNNLFYKVNISIRNITDKGYCFLDVVNDYNNLFDEKDRKELILNTTFYISSNENIFPCLKFFKKIKIIKKK